MEALATISQLPETRAEAKIFASYAVEEIVNGDNDPVRIFAKLRVIGDAIKDILDAAIVQKVVSEEVEKYKGECVINGNKISVQSRKTYDFASCGYSEWEMLDAEIKGLSDRKKQIETMLKSLSNPMADAETGAIIYQPSFKESSFLVVK